MALNKLTDNRVKTARPRSGEYALADGGGLYLRIRPDGRRHWFFRYRFDGTRRKHGIGGYPDISLASAREAAAKCREQLLAGTDPVEAELRARAARKSEKDKRTTRPTVRVLFDEWKRRDLAIRRKDKGVSVLAAFERDVFPRIGNRVADEIVRRDIQQILDAIADRGARHTSNVVRSLLRQMFSFALAREIINADPTSAIRKLEGADNIRERILSPDEIRELAEKLPICGLAGKVQAASWIMLATLARVGELSKARWSDLNFKTKIWIIPAENAKNGREHLIHLSDFALRHFASLHPIDKCPWVYPNRKLNGPIERQTLQKEYRDLQRKKPFKRRNLKPGTLLLNGLAWRLHDCRRSGATLMGELGIRPDVIDRALNHVATSRVTRTYQRQELLEERRRAFQLLGERLDAILAAEPGKVAMFSRPVKSQSKA